MSSFISRHKPDWEELRRLLERARRSAGSLTPAEIARLDVLYRKTTVQLAQVTTRTTDAALARYLNDLCAGAHSIIYLPPRTGPFKGTVQFLLHGFATSIARQWKFHLVSIAVLALGVVIGYYASLADPLAAHAIIPAGETRVPGADREHLLSIIHAEREKGGGLKFLFASELFTHNVKVGILAMGVGILAAAPTLFLLAYNGALLGAMSAVYHQAGLDYEWWAWVLPHGVTELLAIALMGGVGLRLGFAVMCPGRLSREESLMRIAPDAGRTAMGAALMLVAAAIIESYVRSSQLSDGGRYVFAAVSACFWIVYVGLGFLANWGGSPRRRKSDESIDPSVAALFSDGAMIAAGKGTVPR